MYVLPAIIRLALALWVGGMAIFTFLVTPMIFRTQARDVAARIVGVLIPPYFRYLLVTEGIVLALRIAAGGAFDDEIRAAGTLAIVAAVVLTAVQSFWLTPRAERIKATVESFESTPPDHPSRRAFTRLHAASMAMNLLCLLAGLAVLLAG